jgi:hypothetical protein
MESEKGCNPLAIQLAGTSKAPNDPADMGRTSANTTSQLGLRNSSVEEFDLELEIWLSHCTPQQFLPQWRN